jgi:hypothetical protein
MGGIARRWIARRRPKELLLAAEALLLLALFRVCLALVPVRRILRVVTHGSASAIESAPVAPEEREAAIALRVRWAVEAVARNSPVMFVCFPQTLTGYTMLRRRGVQSTMVYGVARTEAGDLTAHTWLMVGDRCVLGGEGSEQFTPVERWR